MPSYTPERARVVATVASLTHNRPDDPRLPGLRAELVTLKLIAAIDKAIGAAPPLNADQRNRIVKAVYGGLGHTGSNR
jgi:hypothetical protein